MWDYRKLKRQDILLILLAVAIACIGLVTIFSATYFQDFGVSKYFTQQLLFFAIGIGMYIFIVGLDVNFISQPQIQILVWLANLALLTIVLFVGQGDGPQRWINIGPFSLQPSEFAKLTVILNTASIFATSNQVELKSLINLYQKVKVGRWEIDHALIRKLLFNLVAVVSMVALIWKQPSLGNALLVTGLWILMLLTLIRRPLQLVYGGLLIVIGFLIYNQFSPLVLILGIIATLAINHFARFKRIILVGLVVLGVGTSLIATFSWEHLFTEYQKERVTAFMNPGSDPLGSQWQVNQASIAIGSGQIFGKGLLQGSQSREGLLPYAYTDFAFSAFAEQFGLVGTVILLGLLYFLIMHIFHLAEQLDDNFSKLVCLGVGIMFALNTIVNIGINLGIMPVTGAPLPLVSYGGSAALVNLIGLALVQMVYTKEDTDQRNVTRLENIP